MRTTLDLDEDILRTAKALAQETSRSLGRTLSDLARSGLQRRKTSIATRSGIPVLPRKAGAKPVTSKIVKDLLELEN